MTTVNIGLPDDQAAALKAKASAPGINVEDWFSTVNRSEDLACKSRHTLAQLVQQCDPQAPLSVEACEWVG